MRFELILLGWLLVAVVAGVLGLPAHLHPPFPQVLLLTLTALLVASGAMWHPFRRWWWSRSWQFIVAIHLIFIVALAGVTAWLVAGDPINQSKWDRVRVGMTKDQVLEILGEPDSYDGPEQIEYSRFLNLGWVEFFFDERNVLIEKNDESVFVSLR